MNKSNERLPFRILLIEDNLADIRLTQEALKECGIVHELLSARNGEEALSMLRNTELPRPDLILLDLNLPRVDGREALAYAKADQNLRRIPIIVLTTSRSDDDITKCYDLHANAYVAKPLDMDEFVRVLSAIRAFWFESAILPTH